MKRMYFLRQLKRANERLLQRSGAILLHLHKAGSRVRVPS